jgi:hypothetical protein
MVQASAAPVAATTWHVGKWGLWGWLETFFRLLGAVAGAAALAGPLVGNGLTVGGNPRLLGIALLALLTLVMLFVIIVRVRQHEVISIMFAVANAIGHVALLSALLLVPASLMTALLFGGFQVLGLAAKALFLRSSGYTEMGASSQSMQVANLGLLAMYAVFTLLMLV